jgi:YebC/PmpR family DNA-binding regulatory protein
MSGHSHWATIRRKKGAQDAKRGKIFTSLAREISVAAREGGGDPNSNLRLQYAVDRARANNMPKDNIERAIKRGTGELREGNALEEITYEGYGPHGVALLISCVTDNRNRTVSDIRHILSRAGGSMGEGGSVAWQFTRTAYFSFPAEGCNPDEIFELAVEVGADDVNFDDETIEIVGPIETFKQISDRIREAGIKPEEAELRYLPNNEIELMVDETLQVIRTIEELEDLDDVQNVNSSLTISDEAMAAIAD